MLTMKNLPLALLALVLGNCSEVNQIERSQMLERLAGCSADGFRCYTDLDEYEIPDGERRGLLLGPLHVPETGEDLDEVVLALALAHEWSGDLRGELHYDIDNNGYADARAPIEIFQIRPCSHTAARLMACQVKLDGLCFFADDPEGPFKMQGDADATDLQAKSWGWSDRPFEVFRGLRTGGHFYLAIADTLAAKRGTIKGWAICLKVKDPES